MRVKACARSETARMSSRCCRMAARKDRPSCANCGRWRSDLQTGHIRAFADEVDGAPNGIKRAKMVVVEGAIRKEAVHGQVYHRYIGCHARRARSGQEGFSRPRGRCDG